MLKGLTETGLRFVNTWECDENAHMNVQFFFAHFQDAEIHFWLSRGLAPQSAPAALTRHVRFHAELRTADMTVLGSGLARGPGGRAVLLHLMYRAPEGELAASCVSVLDDAYEGDAELDLPDEAAPRSVPAEPASATRLQELEQSGYVATGRGVVRPAECAAGGDLLAQHVVARFTDAAGHFWEHVGLSKAWLDSHGYGRVVVESKLTHLAPFAAGNPVVVMSALTGYGSKTITLRHYVLDAATGECGAVGEITGLAVDLATRRAVAWPADRAALFKATLAGER